MHPNFCEMSHYSEKRNRDDPGTLGVGVVRKTSRRTAWSLRKGGEMGAKVCWEGGQLQHRTRKQVGQQLSDLHRRGWKKRRLDR